MLFLITVLASVTIFILVYLVLRTYVPVEGPAELRLKALDEVLQGRTDIDEELAVPFSKRILRPLTGTMASRFARFTPRALQDMVAEKLGAAGGMAGMSPGEFLLLCGFLGLALPMVIATITMLIGLPANKVIGFSMYGLAAGFYFPFFLLSRKRAERRNRMEKDLPDVLDLLTVSVEAGLGFDGALHKLTEKMKGALVEEFSRLLSEMRVGVPRRDALMLMGNRCNVGDVSVFTTALIQADQLGVSIGNVLRVQSAAMREKRKQRAQEKAMKAPIKMLLPLVLFIFPTIFIILLGPAAIQIVTAFGWQ